MEQIVKRLEKETVEFREAYIEKVKAWAKRQVQLNIQRKEAYFQMGRELKEKRPGEDYWAEERWYYRAAPWMFTEELIPKEVKKAEIHFKASLEKLAARIEKKDLKKDQLKVKSAFVDVHFECTISDGEKVVRAWTIIAEGPVQRPHYRYLVK